MNVLDALRDAAIWGAWAFAFAFLGMVAASGALSLLRSIWPSGLTWRALRGPPPAPPPSRPRTCMTCGFVHHAPPRVRCSSCGSGNLA